MIRDGSAGVAGDVAAYGGDATLDAFGCRPVEATSAARVSVQLEACAPGLFAWLDGLPQAVCWRDVLFVHGGLPPGTALSMTWARRTDEHLWIRSGFFERTWDDGSLRRAIEPQASSASSSATRRNGTARPPSTTGTPSTSTPMPSATPACPPGAVQELTLLGFAGDSSFEGARLVTIATADAPERMRR